MKKTVLIIFLVSSTISFAQFISSYGHKVGLTSSQFKWDYTAKSGLDDLDFHSDRKPGLNAGLFVEFFDLPYFTLSTEINYIEKGFQKEIYSTTPESPELGPKVLWKVNFNYINISALAKPKIDLGLFTPYILIGPRLDIEISKSSQLDNPENYKDYLSKRLGIKCGIGSEIKLFELIFLSELVWDIDFKDIYQNPNVNVKTNSFDIRIGIKL